MGDSDSKTKRYILAALGGAAVGGLFVAVATKVLSRAMGKIHEMMSE